MSQSSKHKEEIDLGDLFLLIKKLFSKVANTFLKFVSFVIKQAYILIALIIIGAVIGYIWQSTEVKKVKTDMIVAANYMSAEYLYKSVDQLQYRINLQDSQLLEKLNIADSLSSISLSITPILDLDKLNNEEEKYYNLLAESNFIEEDLKEEMMRGLAKFYKVTLIHPKGVDSRKALKEVLAIIRNNDYYKKVYQLNNRKNEFLINSNEFLIAQIDTLIQNYASNNKANTSSGTSFINNELDLGVLVGNRTNIVEELEVLYAKKVSEEQLFRLVDLGYPSNIKEKSLTSYKLILAPLLLVLGYFALVIFIAIIKKARKLNQ